MTSRKVRPEPHADTAGSSHRASIFTCVLEHTTAGVRRLRAASNPDRGLVVAAVPPDMRRSYPLTWELLEALGKERDITGAGRHEDLNWELAAAWFLAHDVRHLVLVDAQWLTPTLIPDVIGLAAVTGVSLWMVAHLPTTDTYAEALEGWPTSPADPRVLAELVAAAGRRDGADLGEVNFPGLPADSYPTFRAEARRRLSPDEFAVVDQRLWAAYQSASSWFAAHSPNEVDETSVLTYLRGRLDACACAEEMVIEVRGVQIAAHRAGWLVSAVVDRLVATAQNAPASAIHSPLTWRRLRAYREPYRGAVCALVACSMTLGAISSVTLCDVAADGTWLNAAGDPGTRRVDIPPGAELLMRAQVIHRQIQGACDQDLLFATEEGPMATRYLANAVRDALGDLGIPLFSQQVERAAVDPARWARRWGLSVQTL